MNHPAASSGVSSVCSPLSVADFISAASYWEFTRGDFIRKPITKISGISAL
jgi:hypothetical protein